MRIVGFSDLHLHNYKQFDEGGSRLQDGLRILDEVFELASKMDNLITFSGDLYDNQKMLPTSVVNATVAKFKELFEKYPKVVFCAISGNHDFANKNLYHAKGETALKHLADMFPKFCLVDDRSMLYGDFRKIAVVGIPYYEYPEDFKRGLQEAKETAERLRVDDSVKFVMLMQHQTPSGLGNPNIPIDIDVNDELYDAFDFIQNGHIHTDNRMFTDKFLNCGNPLHRDLGDEGEEKGYWIIESEQEYQQPEFVSTKGRYPEFKRVKIKAGEEFVKNDENFYVVETIIEEKEEGEISEEKFGSNLKAEELVRNFWEEVDGQDEDLLKVGLGLLQ